MKDIKAGTRVWCFLSFNTPVVEGVVKEAVKSENESFIVVVELSDRDFERIHGFESSYVFTSLKDCEEFGKQKLKETIEKEKYDIKDMDSLIAYCVSKADNGISAIVIKEKYNELKKEVG